jgi:hypothetical protein
MAQFSASISPFGNVGDLIYVRETFRYFESEECGCSDSPCGCPKPDSFIYFASHDDGESKWKPSIHMPRCASRLTLKVTDVRIEKVQDITESQAISEGVRYHSLYQEWGGVEIHPDSHHNATRYRWYENPKDAYKYLWGSIYGNWDCNPYVWVVEFEVIHKNINDVIASIEQSK